MAKLLLILAVTILLVWYLKSLGRRDAGKRAPKSGSRPAEDMVRCQVCGVNLPRSEALLSRGRVYCCEEHRRKGS